MDTPPAPAQRGAGGQKETVSTGGRRRGGRGRGWAGSSPQSQARWEPPTDPMGRKKKGPKKGGAPGGGGAAGPLEEARRLFKQADRAVRGRPPGAAGVPAQLHQASRPCPPYLRQPRRDVDVAERHATESCAPALERHRPLPSLAPRSLPFRS